MTREAVYHGERRSLSKQIEAYTTNSKKQSTFYFGQKKTGLYRRTSAKDT